MVKSARLDRGEKHIEEVVKQNLWWESLYIAEASADMVRVDVDREGGHLVSQKRSASREAW